MGGLGSEKQYQSGVMWSTPRPLSCREACTQCARRSGSLTAPTIADARAPKGPCAAPQASVGVSYMADSMADSMGLRIF